MLAKRLDRTSVRRLRQCFLLAWALLFALGGPTFAQTACDPFSALNDQARSHRIAGDLNAAEASVQKVLKSAPQDFRANYTEGLIILDRARRARSAHWPGIDKLIQTARTLAQQDPACAKAKNFYSIYNTIGVEFYDVSDLYAAQDYFELADKNRDKLNSDTIKKLDDNLGLIQLRLVHDSACAAKYFADASNAGNANAAGHLAIARTDLDALHKQPGCRKLSKT